MLFKILLREFSFQNSFQNTRKTISIPFQNLGSTLKVWYVPTLGMGYSYPGYSYLATPRCPALKVTVYSYPGYGIFLPWVFLPGYS